MKKVTFLLAVFSVITLFVSCTENKKGDDVEDVIITGENNPLDYVDPFIGTGFHGHTYPGASAPFGAVQLSPDTRYGNWDASSGYHYSDSTIIGFSHTHLSGTGVADLGDVLFHPTTAGFQPTKDGYNYDVLEFSHDNEEASVGCYSVEIDNHNLKVELTADTYVGLHRYTFGKGENQNLFIDMAHLLTDESIDMVELKKTGENQISGMRRTQGWTPDQYVYFVAEFSKEFEEVQGIDAGKLLGPGQKMESNDQQLFIKFGTSDGEALVAKVGISIVGYENALLNLRESVTEFDFDGVHALVRDKWKKELDQIKVEGGTEEELKNFYTSVYHSKLVPNINNDINGQYRRHNMEIATVPKGKKYYSTFSLWDTFRAWNPLQTLIDTALVDNMIFSFLEMYDASGELPIWPLSAGETGTMIGYHSASVIADAYVKGIGSFDETKALEAMVVSSNINKKGSDYYTELGFIPSNIKRESVSCVLEYAYDDWCIAQVARGLNKTDLVEEYEKRALSYINTFDGNTQFFRGKRMDGNWERPFNPFEPGRAYTEATAWQYRFFAPHDVNGLAQLFGGREQLIQRLDSLFTVDSEIHGEMQDITGLIGQYAHGNEPSHHMAYLYNFLGEPWKTQQMTRKILDEMYQATPEGISGNEDAGQISAWYILSSLGIYSVNPGSTQFVFTTPLFEKATVNLANGKKLVIKSNDPKKNHYIDRVELNGKEIEDNYIDYFELMEGGELVFNLIPEPNKKRGVDQASFPYSLTKEKTVSIPYTSKDLSLFEQPIMVDLNSVTENVEIFYTLDGKEPTESSTLYEEPFELSENTTIKARGFKEGYRPSRIFSIEATKANYIKGQDAKKDKNGVNYEYYEGEFSMVADMKDHTVLERGVMPEPSIASAKQEDHFGFIYSGFIEVKEKGVYEFMTRSDDGSVLLINDIKVVDNDGSHAPVIATGRIALEKGLHKFKLLYFEDYEGELLEWGWKTPDSDSFTNIPRESLFTN